MSDPKYPDDGLDDLRPAGALKRRDFLKTLGGGLIVIAAFPLDGEELFQEQQARRGGPALSGCRCWQSTASRVFGLRLTPAVGGVSQYGRSGA